MRNDIFFFLFMLTVAILGVGCEKTNSARNGGEPMNTESSSVSKMTTGGSTSAGEWASKKLDKASLRKKLTPCSMK